MENCFKWGIDNFLCKDGKTVTTMEFFHCRGYKYASKTLTLPIYIFSPVVCILLNSCLNSLNLFFVAYVELYSENYSIKLMCFQNTTTSFVLQLFV